MRTFKLSKQNVLQRVKDTEQSSLNVLEPVAMNNLHKIQFALRSLLNGGAIVSIIVVPAAKEDV